MKKAKYVEVARNTWVDPVPLDDAACARAESDPASAFAQYVLPRIKAGKDEASKEVLAFMKSGESIGDAIAFTIQSLPAGKTKKLRALVEEANSTRIYWQVELHDDHAHVGLRLTAGGPKAEVLGEAHVHTHSYERGIAPYWTFTYAFDALVSEIGDATGEEARRTAYRLFADDVAHVVEVKSRTDYDRAMRAMGMEPADGAWTKAGLYDFTEQPPTYVSTPDEYERAMFADEAENILDEVGDWDEGDVAEACTKVRKERLS